MQTQSVATLKFSGDPFDEYTKMCREAPVFYDAERQILTVYRYEDMRRVFTD